MATGTVNCFDPEKGYGFIEPNDGSEFVFVHKVDIELSGLKSLVKGQKIQFTLVPGMDGKPAAQDIVVLD